LQVDSGGNNAHIIGSLNDKGINGDITANDGVFGGVVPLSAVTAGHTYIQISAAFASTIRRTLSPILPIAVTVAGLPNTFAPIDISMTTTEPDTGSTIVCNELLVIFQPNVSSEAALLAITTGSGYVIGMLPEIGVYQVGYPTCGSFSLAAARTALLASPLVASVDFDALAAPAQITNTPNDPYFVQTTPLPLATGAPQWYLRKIGAQAAWSVAQGLGVKGGVPLAVLDSGVDSGANESEDLFGHVIPGMNWCAAQNCTATNADPSDDYGHGTAVAGLAAALSDNSKGVASPAFNATIFPEKVSFKDQWASGITIAEAILHAVGLHAKVINISQQVEDSKPLQAAIAYAEKYSVLIVAAAANFGNHIPAYPAGYASSYPNLISVGATDQSDERAVWKMADGTFCAARYPSSNYGSWVTMYAPGSEMFVLQYRHTSGPVTYGWYGYDGDYPSDPICRAGTSYSAPLVSGTASLMLAVAPTLSAQAVKTLISCAADIVGTDPDGNVMRRLNAGRAVQYASLGYTNCPGPTELTYDFTGTISSRLVSGYPDPGIGNIGEIVSGSVSYLVPPPTTPNVLGPVFTFYYGDVTNMSMIVSGRQFVSTQSPLADATVVSRNNGGIDGLEFGYRDGPGTNPVSYGTAVMYISFQGLTPVLTDWSVPAVISLNSWSIPGYSSTNTFQLELGRQIGPGLFSVSGSLNSFARRAP
jgi:hypothetical protein